MLLDHDARGGGEPPFSGGVSSSRAMSTNSSDSAFARSRARSGGDGSVTVTSMSTVSGADDAFTFPASSAGGVGSVIPRLSRVRCASVVPVSNLV